MNTNQTIAKTFLISRVRQLLVAVLSVTFGISMYVFMNSFMAGVNATQTEITFTSMSHVKVFNDLPGEVEPFAGQSRDSGNIRMVSNQRIIQYTEGIRNAQALKEELRALPEVHGITTQLNQNVFIKNGISETSASLSGIEVADEDRLFHTSDYMVEGDLTEIERLSNGIVLGRGLAKRMGVGTGDVVQLVTPEGANRPFKVVGLFDTGSIGTDRARAITSIATARQLFSKNKSYATEVLINIRDFNRAREVAQEVRKYTDYTVEAWQDGNSQLDSANVLRDIIAIAVSLTILIVAGFGIYNIMNMTVNEKIKEIAILKAMGFSGRDVIEIFLTQSVVIGFLGGLLGLVTGNIIVRIVDNLPFEIATLTTLPVVYEPMDYLLAFLFGIVITFLAGYLPARQAAHIDPVDILRG